ncbi:hypothetical protein AB4K01_23035 [Serratia fonticola]|jgi:cystathionine beta-lyase
MLSQTESAEYRTVTQWQPGGRALRLQIGLEDMDKLKADLEQGFERLKQFSL